MTSNRPADTASYLVGIDIGSTTTKVVALDAQTGDCVLSRYERHNAAQRESVVRVLTRVREQGIDGRLRVALTGSGAKPIAEAMDVPYIQEVVANSIALRREHPGVHTAIELGGQDAKIIFMRPNTETGELQVEDMRMNGSCAGGTGAFIDEIATILKTPVEHFNELAAEGTHTYDISGRCGVYAKTDIQPLLNQGVSRADLALSTLHAIAKQTIGGLAQGLDIVGPVVFEGGPLTFNPTLVRVFAERLKLTEADVLIPTHPETIVARGAALSLTGMFADDPRAHTVQELIDNLERNIAEEAVSASEGASAPRFFADEAERERFFERHRKGTYPAEVPAAGTHARVWLGIDSGSTTTKFALVDDEGNLRASFYAPNEGDPLAVARRALIELRERWRDAGAVLEIAGVGTTGYGELLFANAFKTECHVVETVAHARAAARYVDDATFILDIGGQDMKAIWLDGGIVTNIVVNEACSSGCGSFLENFANNLGIPVEDIATSAFAAEHPAQLGSRCTVFMNSSIVTEQRRGRSPHDIMAGLCRSIIENVFTKVIRVSNLDSLGERVVVQGGTFENDAVLRAMEQYLGREVTRAPYPGLMGAIGVALLTKERVEGGDVKPSFIGLDALDDFTWTQEANVTCPFCMNHCQRTVVTFSDGTSWVTNNRCERGAILGDPRDKEVREQARAVARRRDQVPNLFAERRRLLMHDWEIAEPTCERDITIGVPRVLSFWETMPFWRTLFRSLGMRVTVSPESTRAMYEEGLHAVASDTVCFPAKLVHGHVRALVKAGVDRIFMPVVSNVPSENTESTSESMCAVVKGYPLVMRNSDNPEKRWGVPFDTPMFYWYSARDRDRQLIAYLADTFSVGRKEAEAAIAAADRAQAAMADELQELGARVIEEVERVGTYAVVLAARPYQTDPLVNHGLPEMLCRHGIPVLTADSLPGLSQVDLSRSRLDVVNNYHARMLASAIMAAESRHLEYVQFVSFGCGHDAYLSDEIVRIMHEISNKTPLILKLDESDVTGPLNIRVNSFVETTRMRRMSAAHERVRALSDPYPVKFDKRSVRDRIVLIPNTSHAFCLVMAAAMGSQGLRTVPLEIGRERAIYLGKKYVHNDICFPAQITIGEALAAIEQSDWDDSEVAVATGKYIGDCRLTHYGALLRKALDDSGHAQVAIVTNDDVDYHDVHPGYKMNLGASVKVAFALPMIDAMEALLRRIRPYELVPGAANAAFDEGIKEITDGLSRHGVRGAARGMKRAVALMNEVAYDRSRLRPTVLIVGEYLLNFHPGANHDIEDYLEQNGFEIIEARMTDVIRKTYFVQDRRYREYHIDRPFGIRAWMHTADEFFEAAHALTDSIARAHPLYERACRLPELVEASDPIVHHTFDAGEGILIPGEILHHAEHGCRNFIILQPFGCLPNHVVGRGIAKRLKELYPDAQILPLDYDPDVSFANLENRLQMMIMNAKEMASEG